MTLSDLEAFQQVRGQFLALCLKFNLADDVNIIDVTGHLWGMSEWKFLYYTRNEFEAPVRKVRMLDAENFDLERDGDFVFARGFDVSEDEDGEPTILILRAVNLVTAEALSNMVREYESSF